ncbi:hypothetical protein L5515_002277 [Caenorhabditis briggsae]|uniref:Serpin domain-containing protein n=1 Tax=Caenorhabditis briggsae TaxID=6238 RepID=A0AAE9J513_CAEBR|nr:hypothetical protein L5515_002277 [Caenorhabditis briggsae]
MSNGLKNLKFLKMNIKDNLLLSCDDLLARYTINEDIEVLELPLSEEPEKFVAFIPRSNGNLSELIENLTTSKFQDLLYKLSSEFVNFEIPIFKIKSNLQYPVPNIFQFEIPDKTEEEVMRDHGFIKRPCETIPIHLYLNRPFLFSVIVEKDPILMGMFNGF